MGRRWKRLEYSPLNEQRKEFNHHIVIKFHESDSMLSRLFKYSINISLEKKGQKRKEIFSRADRNFYPTGIWLLDFQEFSLDLRTLPDFEAPFRTLNFVTLKLRIRLSRANHNRIAAIKI